MSVCMHVCMYVCVHARKYMVRGPSVDGDPVLHVLAGSSVGVAAKVNHVCPSKKAAGRTGRDGIESGSMSFFPSSFRLIIPTGRDIQIVICVPSDPVPWFSLANRPPLPLPPSFFRPPPPPHPSK